jgi:hypothetical protein
MQTLFVVLTAVVVHCIGADTHVLATAIFTVLKLNLWVVDARVSNLLVWHVNSSESVTTTHAHSSI